MVPEFADVTKFVAAKTEMVGEKNADSGGGIVALYAAIAIGLIAWWLGSLSTGIVAAILTFFVLVVLMILGGRAIFGDPGKPSKLKVIEESKIVSVREQVREHRCCIQCKQPAEVV